MGIVTQKVKSAPHSFVDGVEGKVCGAGRKNQRSGAVSCGKWLPMSNYPTNNAYEDGKGISCNGCVHKRRSGYTTETPRDKAITPFKQYPDVPIHTGVGRGVQFEENGPLYVAIADVSGFFGLDERGQFRRLQNDPNFALGLQRGGHISTPGGLQEMWFIRADLVSGWLYLINPNKVREDRRAGLIAYRDACTKALNDYITGSKTAPPSPAHMREVSIEERTPEAPPINEYASLLKHVTQTGESAITMRNHLTLTEQWIDSLPSVVAALEDYLAGLRPLAVAVQNRRNPLRHGWIYVLHDPVGRRYKIGMTQDPDPKKRKAGVEGQWGKGQSVQVVWIETDNIQLERVIHAHYKRRGAHIRDEWYRLSAHDIERIRALGGFVRFRDFTPESLDVVTLVQSGFLSEEV